MSVFAYVYDHVRLFMNTQMYDRASLFMNSHVQTSGCVYSINGLYARAVVGGRVFAPGSLAYTDLCRLMEPNYWGFALLTGCG